MLHSNTFSHWLRFQIWCAWSVARNQHIFLRKFIWNVCLSVFNVYCLHLFHGTYTSGCRRYSLIQLKENNHMFALCWCWHTYACQIRMIQICMLSFKYESNAYVCRGRPVVVCSVVEVRCQQRESCFRCNTGARLAILIYIVYLTHVRVSRISLYIVFDWMMNENHFEWA